MKVATPLAVVTLVVPPSIAPAAPVPLLMAMLTVAVEVVAVLPKASCRTTTGWLLKASLVAVPGFTVNAALVPASVPPEARVAVMVVPDWTLVMVTLCGSGTPFVKAAVVPPLEERVALEVITTVTSPTEARHRVTERVQGGDPEVEGHPGGLGADGPAA